MAKTSTTIDPLEAARQISDKAQSELSVLQAQLPDLQQKVVTLKAEEDEILQQIEARQARRTDLLHSLQTAQTAHTDAVNYASVASGTVGEIAAIQAAVARKNELDDTQSLHDQTIKEHSFADDQAQARLETLRAEIDATMLALHELHNRMRAVEQVKQRSLTELGQHLNDTLCKEYQAYRQHTEEARAALVAAQMDERAFLAQSAAQLEAWPEHTVFKEALGVDSPLIRILQAELAYLDEIIIDSPETARQIAHPNIPVLPRSAQWNWHEVLLIPYQDMFYAGLGSEKSVATMKERRERVASFLEQCKQVLQ